MTTERQVEANRKNAERSTGPRTEEGKARSRGNALKHGLAGSGVVLSEATAAAIEERKQAWSSGYELDGPEAEWTYHGMVAASLQIDRAEAALDLHQYDFASRAILAWDEDRRVEAEAVAAKLARNPGLSARTLEASRHGVELLIEHWERLAEALDAGDWDDDERSHALDLLGVPADLRRGRTPVDFPASSDPVEARRALVRRQVERLSNRKVDSLDELDSLERTQAEATFGAELSKIGLQLWRYRREAWNRLDKARHALRPAPAKAAPRETSAADRDAAYARRVARTLAARGESVTAQIPRDEPETSANDGPWIAPTGGTSATSGTITPPPRKLNRRQRRAMAKTSR
jgi:hypothetical protein